VLSPNQSSGNLAFLSRNGSGDNIRESAIVHPYTGSAQQRDQLRNGSSKSNVVHQQHVVGSGFGSESDGLNERARSPSIVVSTETSGNRAKRTSRTLGPVPLEADDAESAVNRARRPSRIHSPASRPSTAWQNRRMASSFELEPQALRPRQPSSVSFVENDDGEPNVPPQHVRRPSSPLPGLPPYRPQYKHRRRENVITEDLDNLR